MKTPRLSAYAKFVSRNETGQAQVEFVFSSLFIVLLIFGIFELIMLIYTYNVLADSAKEGVRYAIVHGCGLGPSDCSGNCPSSCADAGGTRVSNRVKDYARFAFHDLSTMTVNVNYLDPPGSPTSTPPNRVRVTVSYPYKPFLHFGWPTVTVKAAAEGRIVF